MSSSQELDLSSPVLSDLQEYKDPSNTPPNSFTFLMADTSRPRPSSHDDQDQAQKEDRFAHTRTKRKRTRYNTLLIFVAHSDLPYSAVQTWLF